MSGWRRAAAATAAVLLGLVIAPAASAQASSAEASDGTVVDAREAFARRDKARLAAAREATAAAAHPLAMWVDYWELNNRLGEATQADVDAFYARWRGTYVEDRLRNDWLLELGRRQDWVNFAVDYPRFRMNDDREVTCYALLVEHLAGKAVGDEARAAWYAQREPDTGCDLMANRLHADKALRDADVWHKARLSMDSSRPRGVQQAAQIVGGDAPKAVAAMLDSPVRYLMRSASTRTRGASELAALALLRLAGNDLEATVRLLGQRWDQALPADLAAWVWASVGRRAAQNLLPEAPEYFQNADERLARRPARSRPGDTDWSEDTLAWKVRAALRASAGVGEGITKGAGRWMQVRQGIDAMSEDAQRDPAWVYWKARALLALAPPQPVVKPTISPVSTADPEPEPEPEPGLDSDSDLDLDLDSDLEPKPAARAPVDSIHRPAQADRKAPVADMHKPPAASNPGGAADSQAAAAPRDAANSLVAGDPQEKAADSQRSADAPSTADAPLAADPQVATRANKARADITANPVEVRSDVDAGVQPAARPRGEAARRTRRAGQAAEPEPQRALALELLDSIAGQMHFYGKLAAEDLGRTLTLPERPQPLSDAEREAARNHPGLTRALHLIAIGLRGEGVREWNFSLRGLGDRALLAAAERACEREVWDRCINTSDRTRSEVDIAQRFPTPFRDQVVARAREIDLDPAYVYGLIRQESRFVMDARSSAGASGLMQIMPATARWTARKTGVPFSNDMISDRDVNLRLGTSYLKLVLDDFGGSQAMAAAAYNAGPRRPHRWREGPVLEVAAWAENIPFGETRDYVKKVLSNATYYEALLAGGARPLSLKARLGRLVGPRPPDAPVPSTELP